MTLKEVYKELDRLNAIKHNLEKEQRDVHKEAARKFVGRCYRKDNGAVFKIVSIPIEEWSMHGTIYNEYQFPALFLQYPNDLEECSYGHADVDEFVPCYCDTVYLDIEAGIPEAKPFGTSGCKEISQEEFNAEFDKCIAHYKGLIGA